MWARAPDRLDRARERHRAVDLGDAGVRDRRPGRGLAQQVRHDRSTRCSGHVRSRSSTVREDLGRRVGPVWGVVGRELQGGREVRQRGQPERVEDGLERRQAGRAVVEAGPRIVALAASTRGDRRARGRLPRRPARRRASRRGCIAPQALERRERVVARQDVVEELAVEVALADLDAVGARRRSDGRRGGACRVQFGAEQQHGTRGRTYAGTPCSFNSSARWQATSGRGAARAAAARPSGRRRPRTGSAGGSSSRAAGSTGRPPRPAARSRLAVAGLRAGRGGSASARPSSASVYGWQRVEEQLLGVGDLDQLADVHHRDAVADVLDDAQVVGDEQVGQAELVLQVLEQVEDLRLDRDVERRDRLVADDQLRVRAPARARCRCAGAARR